MKLPIEQLTADSFREFGQVIEQPNRLPDATGPGWQWWDETALLSPDPRSYSIGYLAVEPTTLSFDWAERHMRSEEVIIPSGGDCLVYVGPREHVEQPEQLPPLEHFRVFRVRKGQGVVLHPGVWHGAPLAVDRPISVVVLLLQATGSIDTSLVRFEDTPVDIQAASE